MTIYELIEKLQYMVAFEGIDGNSKVEIGVNMEYVIPADVWFEDCCVFPGYEGEPDTLHFST